MSTDNPPIPPEETPQNPPAARVIPKFSSFKFTPPTALSEPTSTSTTATSYGGEKEQKRSGNNRDRHRESRHELKRRHRSRSRSRSRHQSSRTHDRDRDIERDRGKGKDRDRRHRRDRSCDRDRDRRQKDDEGDSRRSHQQRRSTSSKELVPTSSAFQSQTPANMREKTSEPWYFDKKGDEHNLIYGTIYRYSIPLYRRSGHGRVLGLPTQIVIDRDKSDGKGLLLYTLGAGRGDGARPDRYVYAQSEKRGLKKLKVRHEESMEANDFSQGLDFVQLSKPKARAKNEDKNEWVSGPILFSADVEETSEDQENLEVASESDSDVEFVGGVEWGDRKRMVELIKRVESDPKNVDGWIEYVDQQDSAIGAGNRKRSAAERTSIAEVKLDILEKGLSKNPGNERLLLKFMEVAHEIWDSQKLLSKWRQVLRDNPSSITLWTRYLNFRQTDIISFTYPDCIKCYMDCLDMLRKAVFQARIGSPQRRNLEEIIIYVLLRVVLLMREAGYSELSTAVLQVLLELNIFHPPHITAPSSLKEHQEILSQLETFWDSEVPRIGEPKAEGWESFSAAGEIGDAPNAIDTTIKIPQLDPRDPFGSWLEAEAQWSNRPSMPARTTDDVEEDDPYRVVLFSDLKSFIVRLSCQESTDALLEAFLTAHGLSSLYLRSSNNSWSKDQFLWNGLSAGSPGELQTWFWPKKERKFKSNTLVWEGMEPEKQRGAGENPFSFQIKNFPLGEESLFGRSGKWFEALNGMVLKSKEAANFIQNVLEMIVEKTSSEAVAVYYLAWMWANSLGSIKKVAKSLLQKFKTSLRLWTAYGQIEWHESGKEAGAKIFTLALNMSRGFSEESRRDVAYLWHAWIWEELSCGNVSTARRLVLSVMNRQVLSENLCSSVDDVSKPQFLASRQHFEQQQLRYGTIHPAIASIYTDLLGLLHYLCTPTPSLTSITNIYTSFTSALNLNAPVHELTLLRHLRLLYYHNTTSKPYQPSLLRINLETALTSFPHSTAFLALYLSNEARTKIENRMRNILSQHNAISTPTSTLFAIWVELHMSEYWNQHSIRRIFESALESTNMKHSLLLWQLYREFEVRAKDLEKGKMVLWRGMRECPWSKDVVVSGLRKLFGVMDGEEIWKCVAIAGNEKELRFHDTTELEDAWEEMRMAVSRKGRMGTGTVMGMTLPDDIDSDVEMED